MIPEDFQGPNTRLEWPLWRLVMDPNMTVSMQEIEDSWTLMMVADANEAIDVREDIAEWRRQVRKAEREQEEAIAKHLGQMG